MGYRVDNDRGADSRPHYDHGDRPKTPKQHRWKVYLNGVHLSSSVSREESERMAEYLGGEVRR